MISKEQLVRLIDHTNLHTDATEEDIEKLCQEALDCNFRAVCVRPEHVAVAKAYLGESEVRVASVVGFPREKHQTIEGMIQELFRYDTANKIKETVYALGSRADEIDMVLDLEAMSGKDYDRVRADIRGVVGVAGNKIIKVIIETGYWNPNQITLACRIAEEAGARYVKTSTGFGRRGATVGDMSLMDLAVSSDMGIKASGGIDTVKFAQQLCEASQILQPHPFRIGASKLAKEYMETGEA